MLSRDSKKLSAILPKQKIKKMSIYSKIYYKVDIVDMITKFDRQIVYDDYSYRILSLIAKSK